MDKEIVGIIMKSPNDKAPGKIGLKITFFKKSWLNIKIEVIRAVKKFFISSKMLKEVNNTYVVLILKSNNIYSMKDFRPISLCNLSYKIITKIMVDMLQTVLPTIISPN